MLETWIPLKYLYICSTTGEPPQPQIKQEE